MRAEGARFSISTARVGVESGAPGAAALYNGVVPSATIERTKRTDGRTEEGTGKRHVNKYLLKSLINLLLAGVDIPYEWAPR